MSANIDQISNGRFSLNTSPRGGSRRCANTAARGVGHDERYGRTREFLEVMRGMWTEEEFTYNGRYYKVEKAHLEPKPVRKPWPTIYAGGESEDAKQMISRHCDGYLMHGDPLKTSARRSKKWNAAGASWDWADDIRPSRLTSFAERATQRLRKNRSYMRGEGYGRLFRIQRLHHAEQARSASYR